MNQDPSNPNGNGWETPGDATLPPAEPKGFFTPLRCCGCLVILGVLAIAAFGGMYYFGVNMLFPKTPIEIPPNEATPLETQEIRERVEQVVENDGTVTLTPRELSILLEEMLKQASGAFAPGTARVHCEGTPDGHLRLRFSGQLSEHTPLYGGRYLNIRLTGALEIDQGEVVRAEFVEATFGELPDGAGTEEQSKQWYEQFINNSLTPEELRVGLGKIDRLRFDGETIEFRLKGSGGGNAASTDPPRTELEPEGGPTTTETPTTETPTTESGSTEGGG